MKRSVLLLDRNYAPIRVVSWKRAVQLVIGREVAEILAFYDDAATEYDMAVIRLVSRAFPGNPFSISTKFHKKQVLIRDKYTCLYCGCQKKNDLTIDHIIPSSRGGNTSYLNCVAACFQCNQRKGDKTPEEARMPLLAKPTHPVRGVFSNIRDIPSEWSVFAGVRR